MFQVSLCPSSGVQKRSTNRIRCSALVVQSGLEEMRWIPCAVDGCDYTLVVQSGLEEMRWILCALYGSGYGCRITTAIKCTRDPPHLLKFTTARPVQNTVCDLLAFSILLMMGIMVPETCWVTNFNLSASSWFFLLLYMILRCTVTWN
jgi:hypothetical protein